MQPAAGTPVETAFSLLQLDADGILDIVSTQVGGCTVKRPSSDQ